MAGRSVSHESFTPFANRDHQDTPNLPRQELIGRGSMGAARQCEKQCRIHQGQPAPMDAAQSEILEDLLLSAGQRNAHCSGGKRSIQLSYGP